jgi:hypothetical protein
MNRARLALSVVGFILAFVGVLRDDRRIVWAAIVVIAVVVIARVVAGRRKQMQ